MGLLDSLFGRKQAAASGGDQVATSEDDAAPATRVAKSNEHYVLTCYECGFTHDIPKDCYVPPAAFSVDVDEVRMQCVYGGAFTVSLQVGDFFSVAPVPESGKVLHASIADNMKVLNGHILSHCDPVFLSVLQTPNRTEHRYARQPEGATYAKVTKAGGTDIVGSIDVSKAEIPGVSW